MSVVVFPNSSLPKVVPPAPLRTAIVVDDSSTILHAVCSLLEHHNIVNVVGRAESGLNAMSEVQMLKPDLLLMDAEMPGMSGLRASLMISQIHPEITIILMSMDTGHRFVQACLDCGAHAVIYKPRFLKELRQVLKLDSPQMVDSTLAPKQAIAGI
jgi:DNA-binding NarL/FixJ family response regulator